MSIVVKDCLVLISYFFNFGNHKRLKQEPMQQPNFTTFPNQRVIEVQYHTEGG